MSDIEIIRICNDKLLMQEFFEANDIRIPKLKDSAPAIVKPVNGMGSAGIYKVDTDEELAAAKVLSKNPVIVQELVGGTEYTIDVLCDFDGNVVLAIPRIRVEVRDGEVSKSRVALGEVIEETVTDFKEVSTYRFIKGLYRYE